MRKTFAEKLVLKITAEDLDGEYPFYTEKDQDFPNEVLTPSSIRSQIPSMDIDIAIDILQKLKVSGANRVYFDTHIDHAGYHFYGTRLTEI